MSDITGYRTLTENEIREINYIKQMASSVEQLVLSLKENPTFDYRWISIGATNLQQGFMALTRAVARPTNF